MYHELFRPQYHFSPPRSWLNDPNGLVYDAGEYHLFYQYHPDDIVWGPMHWGHAVSHDLIHWQHLPIALKPDEHGTIFSGSAVIDHNNTAGFGPGAMVAVFSYHTQTQGVAYSLDHGRTWTKYAHNPVIDALAKDFRDPKVFWHDKTGQWIMILAAGYEAQLFTSPNLLNWTYSSKFTGGENATIWEVPDLFPLDIDGQTKWVLVVSISGNAPAGGGIQYFVGDFDGRAFTTDQSGAPLWLDYGPDNYAGWTWDNTPDGKRIYIGWMNNWAYGAKIPTSTWRGAMTLPREFRLVHTADGLRLAQTPIATVTHLRSLIDTWDQVSVSGVQSLDNAQGRTLEIIAELDPGTAAQCGLKVQYGATGHTRITYDAAQSRLSINRSTASIDGEIPAFTPVFGAPIALDGGVLRLHIFVDESSVEVFANDGTITLTSQTFVDPANNGLALFADDGVAAVSRLEVYSLSSIWPEAGSEAGVD